ncbi:sulfatase-like hydrolase/transferase [Halocatena salina]|uniref:Sulfatase-like hydrolase/transferase n=1 Tax=Halocatena salina TaxID=2934340 RepID=A0A8U0A9T6_9EURY|nr:sulfatase-like hydrolase/transferase [Halocatena salina]UPM44723.1 sulfatase-like hydrolase/transferase [Halocatena salina]
MKVLLLSIDSLRRDFLSAYQDTPTVLDYEVNTPNLDWFAEKATVFEQNYAGSLPCMPARREWHTGIQEFLWRPWGPIEPFDDTLPQLARKQGILTKLITDHYHYFQHGSHGYYEDYNGFEFIRGHETDAWKTTPQHPNGRLLDQTTNARTDPPDSVQFMNRVQYARNIANFDETDEEDFFAAKVFSRTADWIAENQEWDDWFCFVDSFDVHEPFHCPEPYASMYTDEDPRDASLPTWPYYGRVDEGQSELSDREIDFVKSQFAGKVTMVDHWLGTVFDTLTELSAWDDTMVIVTSDHGYMLGEHGWIAKNIMPIYDAIANTPLFVWHPESVRNDDRVSSLTSAVDIYATILSALGVSVPDQTHSQSFLPLLEGKATNHREWALYGMWGSSVNVADGQYTYMRPCNPDEPTYCYSTTMMDAWGYFTPTEPKQDVESGRFLPYTDTPVWRFEGPSFEQHDDIKLYDTDADPEQSTNLAGNHPAEQQMEDLLADALQVLKAPENQFERLGLTPPEAK